VALAQAPGRVPIQTSSRIYLAQQLGRYGIETGRIPEACMQELADYAVSTAKSLASFKGESWRAGITDSLDGHAGNIAEILSGEKSADEIQQNGYEVRQSRPVRH
jgi:hypothetical protein